MSDLINKTEIPKEVSSLQEKEHTSKVNSPLKGGSTRRHEFRAICKCSEPGNKVFENFKAYRSNCICDQDQLPLKWSPVPHLYYAALCCDELRNKKMSFTTPIPMVCSFKYKIPHENHKTLTMPRFLARFRKEAKNDLCIVEVLHSYILVMSVTNIVQIYELLAKLCEVCLFPIKQCQCGEKLKITTSCYEVRDYMDRPLIDNRSFERVRLHGVVVRHKFLNCVLTKGEVQNKMTVLNNYVVNSEPYLKVAEDFITFFYWVRKSKSKSDVCVALGALVRSVTGRSVTALASYLIEMVLNDFWPSEECQSTQSNWCDDLESLYNKKENFFRTKLAKRFRRFFNHVIMQTLLYKCGLPIDKVTADMLDRQILEPNYGDWFTLLTRSLDLSLSFLNKEDNVL